MPERVRVAPRAVGILYRSRPTRRPAFDAEPCEGAVIASGLYSTCLEVGCALMGGWDPFGPARLITLAEGDAYVFKNAIFWGKPRGHAARAFLLWDSERGEEHTRCK